MKTEHRLAETLKKMMAEMPLDDISVSALSKRCQIDRKTFYYHFHDIFDLLTLVFLDEKIDGIQSVDNVADMVKAIYNYYAKNTNFIDATLDSAGKELFSEFIYNNCYLCLMRFVVARDTHKKLTSNERKNIARFYGSAFSNSIVYYLANYKHKSLEGLNGCFTFFSKDSITKIVNHLIKAKENK